MPVAPPTYAQLARLQRRATPAVPALRAHPQAESVSDTPATATAIPSGSNSNGGRLERGTAHQRGYTYRWRVYAKRYLQQHPLCRLCEHAGKTAIAVLVDHIVKPPSPQHPLFSNPNNHQPLCRDCHKAKTAQGG